MPRLPLPDSDNGQWGQILNDFLETELLNDGSANAGQLKIRHNGLLDSKYTLPTGGVPTSDIADQAVTTTKLSNGVNDVLAEAHTAVQNVNGKNGQTISLTASDVSAIPSSQKGASGGVASLTGTTLTLSQLPTSVITKSSSSSDTGKAIDAYTGAPLTLPAASGSTNTVDARVLIKPTSQTENGIVVKAPDGNWGQDDLLGYGQGQYIMFLKEDVSGSTEPDDLVMFRVNSKGGLGLTGGMHVATGLRRRPDDTPSTQGIWVNNIDDMIGVVIEAANNSPAYSWLLCNMPNGNVVVEIDKNGVLNANRGIKIQSGASGTLASLFIGRTSVEGALEIVASANTVFSGSVAGDMALGPLSGQTLALGEVLGGNAPLKVRRDTGGTKVGFHNTSPVTKPTVTGSRGGNAALASLIAALASYGLVTDSTSA